MSEIVKICKFHGELTLEQISIYKRKPPRNYSEKVCKLCRKERSNKNRNIIFDESVIERKCSRCKIIKPKSEFRGHQWKLFSPYCDICRPAMSTKEYDKNRSHLKKRYNLKIEDYNKMLEQQNSCCEICGKSESALGIKKDRTPKRLSVDHNHATNKIRGLLCQRCNQGIGSFLESIIILESAVLYIKKYNQK